MPPDIRGTQHPDSRGRRHRSRTCIVHGGRNQHAVSNDRERSGVQWAVEAFSAVVVAARPRPAAARTGALAVAPTVATMQLCGRTRHAPPPRRQVQRCQSRIPTAPRPFGTSDAIAGRRDSRRVATVAVDHTHIAAGRSCDTGRVRWPDDAGASAFVEHHSRIAREACAGPWSRLVVSGGALMAN
eukprot:480288-Prymnesium_polylepis.2